MNYLILSEKLDIYVNVDVKLDTPTRLELRHDLQDFVKEHSDYRIWLFDGGEPTVIDNY
jgi:hypothetical protein